MKLKDIGKLGLEDKTIAEIEVNPLQLITNDEFNSHSNDYRATAIDRILNLRIRFTSEFNTLTELFKRVVSLKCPHCGKEIKVTGGGGNAQSITYSGECELCKVSVFMSIPVDAISYLPQEARNERD